MSTGLSAQRVYPLYAADPPCATAAPTATELKEDIGLIVTNAQSPELHHYAPVPREASGGAVLIAPGGGYWIQAWDLEGVDIARRLANAGLHAFVLRYRLPAHADPDCRSSVALSDAQRGLQYIRSMAASLGYSPDHVAVMGFSAGGHLAGSASVHHLEPDPASQDGVLGYPSRPDASVLVYPVITMDARHSGHQGSQEALLGDTPSADLLHHFNLPNQVDTTTPPALLVHASDDTGVPVTNSLRYYEALQRNGIAADLRVYATGGHGFGSAVSLDSPVRGWLDETLVWLRNRGW